MNEILALETTVVTSAIIGGIIYYIRHMKIKVKRFVFRNEEIQKYFR
jgi:hypothetical protein